MFPEKRLELVHFQLTRNCNLRCWFCGQWGNKGFFSDASGERMSFDDWKKIINSLINYRKNTGINPSIILWGGEPLVSPNFGKIAEYLYKNNFEIGIVTNGTLIDKWADILKKYFKKIYISIDGTQEIHDSIRGKGVFNKVFSNVKLLKGTNAEIIIMTVLSQAILEKLPEFPYALEQLNPSQLLLQDMIHMSENEVNEYIKWLKKNFNKDAKEIQAWKMSIDADFELKKNLALNEVFKQKYPFEVKYMPHGDNALNKQCLSPFRHLHIAWNGNVLYCTDFYDFCAGNAKNEDIIDIFNNDLSQKFRAETYSGNCVTCNHCSWRNNKLFNF